MDHCIKSSVKKVLAFLLFLSQFSWATVSRVNTALGGTEAGTTLTLVTGAFASTTGNLIVVAVRNSPAAESISSVTDTAGNTYTPIDADTGQDPHMRMYYAKNITGNAANKVTATCSTAVNYSWIYAIEYSGCDTTAPLDATGTNAHGTKEEATGSFTKHTNAITTANANGVVVVFTSENNFSSDSAGDPSFTLIDGNIKPIGTNAFGGVQEDITSSALSAYIATFTSTASTNNSTQIWASFIAAGGSSPATLAPQRLLQGVGL